MCQTAISAQFGIAAQLLNIRKILKIKPSELNSNPCECYQTQCDCRNGLARADLFIEKFSKNSRPKNSDSTRLGSRAKFQFLMLFFYRFCGFKDNRISETLSLGEKSLSLAKNLFILMGEIWNFP